MKNIDNIVKELRGMVGHEVGSGYFKHVVEDTSDCDLLIDTCKLLESLKDFEIDDMTIIEENDGVTVEMDTEEFIDATCKEIRATNTYNWSSPVSNDLNIEMYENNIDSSVYVILRVHYGASDIRCGYSNNIYLYFDDEYDFYNVIYDNDKFICVTIDGINYDIQVGFFLENYEVVESESGDVLDYSMASEIVDKAIDEGQIKGY